jgi:hypothetical protein
MRTPARTLCASAALIVAATVAAPAAIATGATTAPETFLVLGVQSRSGGQFVTVRCDPVSGTHPHPEAVCKALGASGGDINKVIAVVVKSNETGCVYGVGCGWSTGWLIQATLGSWGGRGRRVKRSGCSA